MQGIANNIFIKAIHLYQKFISPRKGYCCAHRTYHGRSSCSEYAIHSLNKHNLLISLSLMKRRFLACQMAYEELKKEKEQNKSNNGVEACPCANKESAYCCLGAWPFS